MTFDRPHGKIYPRSFVIERNEMASRSEDIREIETGAILRWLSLGDVVLDVGCGDGASTVYYAARVGRLVGIDCAPGAIERARSRLAKLAHVELHTLPAQRAAQLGETFDVVVTQRCLIHIDEPGAQQAALAALAGLVRLGGRCLILECTEQARRRIDLLRVRDGLPPFTVPWGTLYFDRESLVSLMETGGFELEAFDSLDDVGPQCLFVFKRLKIGSG